MTQELGSPSHSAEFRLLPEPAETAAIGRKAARAIFAAVALAAAVIWSWPTVAAYVASNPGMARAITQGGLVMMGSILAVLVVQVIAAIKERKERVTMASALMTELLVQAPQLSDGLAMLSHKSSTAHGMSKDEMAVRLVPDSIVFRSLVGRVPALGSRAATALVEYHCHLDKGRLVASSLRDPSTIAGFASGSVHSSGVNAMNQHNSTVVLALTQHWIDSARLLEAAFAALAPTIEQIARADKAFARMRYLIPHAETAIAPRLGRKLPTE